MRFHENEAKLRFIVTVYDIKGKVLKTLDVQLMGNTNADGHTRSPRIYLGGSSGVDPILCKDKKRGSKVEKVFERAPFPYDGPSDDAEQLEVKQVAGTNYGEYYNSRGETVDASQVVWHFKYEGDAVTASGEPDWPKRALQVAALKRIRVELLADEGVAEEGGMEGQ